MAAESKFNQEDADTICAALAEGHSLLSICEAMGIPYSTARQWEADHPEHAANSARARELGCHYMAEQCLEIADDARNDWMERLDREGQGIGWMLNGDHVQRSRLRIDTRMRLIGKWLPKVYGDRTTLAGDPDAPLAQNLSDEQLAQRIEALQAKTRPA